MIKNRDKNSQNGFTLVEIAIVMVIIGLLIGGILKGGEMIENARINSFIKQVSSYKSAYNIFKDKHNMVAGDMIAATTRLPGCNAATFCLNGNGDLRVDNTVPADAAYNEIVVGWPETTQFWKHLALADIVSGIDTSGNPATPSWGRTHPSTSLGGGFEFYYDNNVTTSGASRGGSHILRLSTSGINGGPIVGTSNGALTPTQSASLDRKMDDGNGNQGSVVVEDSGNSCAENGTGTYKETRNSKDCILLVLFDK